MIEGATPQITAARKRDEYLYQSNRSAKGDVNKLKT
jgi:hypothetical protein